MNECEWQPSKLEKSPGGDNEDTEPVTSDEWDVARAFSCVCAKEKKKKNRQIFQDTIECVYDK